MAYSAESIMLKVREALKNPASLYSQEFVNYTGHVEGERETEIAAREISEAENLLLLRGIPSITRHKSYKTESHIGLAKRKKPNDSNRDEEWLAISLYGKTLDPIGKIIDFQTPLKDVAVDKAGKIDLLSYNKSEDTAYILELKKPSNAESLLRCVLQAYTYWKIVDGEKLLHDFEIQGATLCKGILIYKNCAAYQDFQDEGCKVTYNLMGELGVDLFVFNEEGSRIAEAYKQERLTLT